MDFSFFYLNIVTIGLNQKIALSKYTLVLSKISPYSAEPFAITNKIGSKFLNKYELNDKKHAKMYA